MIEMAKVKLKKNIKTPNQLIRTMRSLQKASVTSILDNGIHQREDITNNWSKKNQPKFIPRKRTMNRGIFFGIEIQGEKAVKNSKTVYQLLNDGTKVIKVMFSRNYKRSTTPRVLKSNRKRGRVVKVSRNFNFKGIEKRDWDNIINKNNEPRTLQLLKSGGTFAFKFNRRR